MSYSKSKKIFSVAAVLLVAVSLMAGCGKDKEERIVVATLGEEEILLKEAVFYARINQADFEQKYSQYYGAELWSSDLSGNGMTLEEEVKNSVMSKILETHVIGTHARDYGIELAKEEEAEIEEVAASFIGNYEPAVLEAAGATLDYTKEVFSKATLARKVRDAAVADIDLEVSDEEAKQKTITYTWIATVGVPDAEGNFTTMSEEEKLTLKEKAEEIVEKAREDADFEGIINQALFTPATVSYGSDLQAEGVEEFLLQAAEQLNEGEVSDVIEKEDGYYIVKLNALFDEEATNQKKEEIIEQRKQEAFQEIYNGWVADAEFVINEEVWSGINFNTPISQAGSLEGSKQPEDAGDLETAPEE